MKKLLLIGSILSLSIIFLGVIAMNSFSRNDSRCVSIPKINFSIVDSNAQKALNDFNSIRSLDETMGIILDNTNFTVLSQEQLTEYNQKNSDQGRQALAINIEEFMPNRIKEFGKLIETGAEIYFYGNDLDLPYILSSIGLKDNQEALYSKYKEVYTPMKEEWNVIGFKNGKIILESRVRSTDLDGNFIQVSLNNFIHSILHNILSTENLTEQPKSSFEALSYGSDTIVASAYNQNSYVYSNNILRGQLNVDWILFHNTRSDNDPNYDYFYMRNNVELNAYNHATSRNIETEHKLPFSSDNMLDWGPKATSSASGSIAVSLPWSVSWNFTPGDETMKINLSGGQTTDQLNWKLFKGGYWPYHNYEYPMPIPSRLQPGTAWASASSGGSNLAAITITNTAKVRLGITDLNLSMPSRSIFYSY